MKILKRKFTSEQTWQNRTILTSRKKSNGMTRQNNIVEHGTVWRQTQLTMERRMRFGKSGQRNYPANNYCLGRHEPTFNRPYDCILIIERHSMYVHAGMGCSYPQRMHIFAEIRSIYSAILRIFSIPIVQPFDATCVFLLLDWFI